jgi:hypothetical protein
VVDVILEEDQPKELVPYEAKIQKGETLCRTMM